MGPDLLLGFFFGAVGGGYCLYARQQRRGVPLVCGLGLMFFPYFVDGLVWTLLVGAVLMALPWYFRDF